MNNLTTSLPRHTWVASLLACALAGCSLTPTLTKPAPPIPAQWPAGSNATATTAVADVAWQDFFTDPALQLLIKTALANNRDLRVALLNIEQAKATLGIKSADQFPTLNATVAGSRTPTTSGSIINAYSAGVTVTAYELDFFGRVASLKDQAVAQLLATTEGSNTAQISLIATVAQTWLSLLADEELLAITAQTLATRENTLKLVNLRFEHGAASELDVRQAQSLLETARATLAQQTRQRALNENVLVLLLGQPVPLQVRSTAAAGKLNATTFAELPAGLPSTLLTRRPDIRQAEHLLSAANASIGAARAAMFPRIALTAGAGTASTELSGLFKDGTWGFTFAPQLVLPLLDGGRNQAAVDSARVGLDIAIAQYEKSIQTAFREVSDALAGRDTLAQQQLAQQAQFDAESGRARLTNLRYENGAASQLEWLDAQRSVFSSQQALVQVRLAYLQNQITLYKTLGGGISATTP